MELSPRSRLSDLTQVSIATHEQALINTAKERGYVTFEEVQALYPESDEYLDAIDAHLLQLVEVGVTPVSAASVQPAVEDIAAAWEREAVSSARRKARAPLDPVDLYLEEIRQFPILTRDQERWLGIAIECAKLTLDNPEMLGSGGTAQTLETFFGQLLELAARELERVRRRISFDDRLTFQVSEQFGRLVQEVQWRQQGNLVDKSPALPQLIEWCPEKAHNSLFHLCGYLYALPTLALQFLQEYISSSGRFPPNRKTIRYCLDGCSQLSQEVRGIRRRAEQAKQTLILHNLRLVSSVAWRYKDQGVPISDLYQEGNMGLIKAVERFDPSQGNKLSTYAVWWIRQSITRAIADQCRIIRLPVHMHDALSRIHRAEDALREQLDREPETRELAKQCEMSLREVKRVLNREPRICSLDSLLCCSEFPLDSYSRTVGFVQLRPCPTRQYAERSYLCDGLNRDDDFECPPCLFGRKTLEQTAAEENVDYSTLMLGTSSQHKPGVEVATRQLREILDRALNGLTKRQRFVIEMRFGLKDGQVYTLEEIGQELGLTRERIRQIESKALTNLRLPRQRRILQHCL